MRNISYILYNVCSFGFNLKKIIDLFVVNFILSPFIGSELKRPISSIREQVFSFYVFGVSNNHVINLEP